MSVTNGSVPAGGNGGGSSSPPTTATTTATSSTSPTTTVALSVTGSSLLLQDGSFSTAGSTPAAGSTTADVVKSGYLRKFKGKKKFFVLRKETSKNGPPARLEYYDKEKKFITGEPPKKCIVLKACFSISRTESTKCKYSIALHTHNDCVRMAMSNEEEMNDWLRVMNSLVGEEEQDQMTNYHLPAERSNPHFEHIWFVKALNKGLGSKYNIIGPYRLCLTSKELTLLKVGEGDARNGMVKFPLNVIRSVSHDATFGTFFHIEMGRFAPTGPGQLSLKTEDNNIAQNMHLLILNAMQNYSTKEDVIPRERDPRRALTYTWNNDQGLGSRICFFHSHSSAPSGMTRFPSMDGSMSTCTDRGRTDSMSSSLSTGMGGFEEFNSPMSSTCTDSASSSYSIDYGNNNHHSAHHRNHHGGRRSSSSNLYGGGGSSGETGYSNSQDDDESYVPWKPDDEEQAIVNSLSSLTLPLNQATSPMSSFDNYMAMSPDCGTSIANLKNSVSGQVSVSHSRNSLSLIEEHDGYVSMSPMTHSTTCESGGCSTAGSTTGLNDPSLDMDFARKLNMSNEDVWRMSPASSESMQSGTPSSDFPLEKVSSYLTGDFDDTISIRQTRAYSAGSRPDTSMGKNRSRKNSLEAIQEFRIRAMSVGSKTKRPPVNSGGKSPALSLSSSWCGSTGRWPPSKLNPISTLPTPHHSQVPVGGGSQAIFIQPSHNHSGSESNDSDLMELDFSHNKSMSRKRSLSGSNNGNTPSGSIVGSGSITKISPVPEVLLSRTGRETPPAKSAITTTTNCIMKGVGSTSTPISIQKARNFSDHHAYHHHHSLSFSGTTNSKSKGAPTAATTSSLARSLGSSGNLSTFSAHSNSRGNSSMSVSTQQEVEAALRCNDPTSPKSAPTQNSALHNSHHSSSTISSVMDCHSCTLPPTTTSSSSTSSGLSRIEEFPEKL